MNSIVEAADDEVTCCGRYGCVLLFFLGLVDFLSLSVVRGIVQESRGSVKWQKPRHSKCMASQKYGNLEADCKEAQNQSVFIIFRFAFSEFDQCKALLIIETPFIFHIVTSPNISVPFL